MDGAQEDDDGGQGGQGEQFRVDPRKTLCVTDFAFCLRSDEERRYDESSCNHRV
jgi:hypothetical protein